MYTVYIINWSIDNFFPKKKKKKINKLKTAQNVVYNKNKKIFLYNIISKSEPLVIYKIIIV